MKFSYIRYGRGAKAAVIPLLAFALCLTGLGLASDSANAQTKKAAAPMAAPTKSKTVSAKKSDDELKAIAVATVPGQAIDVAIEWKLGANRYVVEVLSTKAGGAEVDVLIDMDTYKVIGLDK